MFTNIISVAWGDFFLPVCSLLLYTRSILVTFERIFKYIIYNINPFSPFNSVIRHRFLSHRFWICDNGLSSII